MALLNFKRKPVDLVETPQSLNVFAGLFDRSHATHGKKLRIFKIFFRKGPAFT